MCSCHKCDQLLGRALNSGNSSAQNPDVFWPIGWWSTKPVKGNAGLVFLAYRNGKNEVCAQGGMLGDKAS